jgi:antitoxin MazE
VKTTVRKWGNSLGLRIPKSFAEEASIREGTPVDLSISDGELIIRPLRESTYSLQDLVSRVTKANLHDEASFGEPEGQEAW